MGGLSHFFQVAVGYGALHALDVFPRFFGKREHNLARGVGVVGAERCQCGEVECVGLVICHGSLNHVDNFLLAERLVQTSGKAFAAQRVYVHVAACGHGYYGNRRCLVASEGAEDAQQVEAVHGWHLDVGKHGVVVAFCDFDKQFLWLPAYGDVGTKIAQHGFRELQLQIVVVDEQQAPRLAEPGVCRGAFVGRCCVGIGFRHRQLDAEPAAFSWFAAHAHRASEQSHEFLCYRQSESETFLSLRAFQTGKLLEYPFLLVFGHSASGVGYADA